MWFAQTEDLLGTDYEYMYSTPDIAAPVDETGAALFAGVMLVYLLVILAISVLSIVAMWKIFSKAGEAGWKALIPFYNIVVFLNIIGRPVWWILLLFIPVVNIVVSIITALDLAKSFGRSEVFAIFGLLLFSPIGHLIIAFSRDTYKGPAGRGIAAATQPVAPTTPQQTPFQS